MKYITNLFKQHKILRFIFAGSIGAFSQIFMLYLFVEIFQLWYLLASSIAFCISIVIGYVLQKFFTFRDYSKNIKIQFSSFFVFTTIMFFFNMFLMYLYVDIFKLMYILAQMLTSICGAFISYTVFNKAIFK